MVLIFLTVNAMIFDARGIYRAVFLNRRVATQSTVPGRFPAGRGTFFKKYKMSLNGQIIGYFLYNINIYLNV